MKWGQVVFERLREGRGSVLGPDTWRRARWWDLTLDCGHLVQRTVRYKPLPPGQAQHGGTQRRSKDDVLPAPTRVVCAQCPTPEMTLERR